MQRALLSRFDQGIDCIHCGAQSPTVIALYMVVHTLDARSQSLLQAVGGTDCGPADHRDVSFFCRRPWQTQRCQLSAS